ncbi:alkaline phosphatase PhoX [Cohnella thermotolerans]|uniref:alkaline phosphatase PhoX n=1 Tax=Cohnella thermotolerans TaxID=329858 RepID=UPI00040E4E08|nr:alkaline phosphatase PhoX [Cohnella thermotolerans]
MTRKRIKTWAAPVLGLALALPAAMPAQAAPAHATVKSIEFVGMSAPVNAQQMAQVYTGASVKVTYSDNTVKTFPLTYKQLFKSTDSVGGTIAGVSVDAKGNPIMDTSVPNSPVPFVSDSPDSNSLFQVPGMSPTSLGGNPLSLVTHYEYITSNNAGKSAYGLVPASMSLTKIDQNKTTGELTPVELQKIDFSGVDGLWIPCNGSLTPWNTHLGSEEYEADARAYEADPTQTYVGPFVQSYYQDTTKKGNPYDYNYIVEVSVDKNNKASVAKHYSLGRFSHELAKVAPDAKTVYFGDDGGNTMLFMYVADKAQDLSSGTLYAAKWIQTSAENGGSANLQWIKLGHATDSEVRSEIDKGLKFSDIFEKSEKPAEGFTAIKTYPSGNVEYLKLKPGMEKAAAFLESRRYAAMLGATSEFNKMEGVTVNAKDKKAYIAMSYVEKAMLKDDKGTDPVDDIQVNKISAGVTYELALVGGQKDKAGEAIASDYVPQTMKGLVWGEDLSTPDAKGNKAADDKVANPDNLSYSEQLRTLFIGEDSGLHANNYVWAYNIDTHKLSRILSTPSGAEATGLQVVDDLNGFSYVMSNLQHPGDEMIVPDPLKTEVLNNINLNFNNRKSGVVGYISGIPSQEQLAADAPVTVGGQMSADASVISLRTTAEASGAKVDWHGKNKEVVVTRGSHTLTLRVGEQTATIDGTGVSLPVATRFEKGKVMFSASVWNQFVQL